MFVFFMTDNGSRWIRHQDWQFGLVTRDRQPKPALQAISHAYAKRLSRAEPRARRFPRVCTCNGRATIRDCLEGLAQQEYANYEVIALMTIRQMTLPVIAPQSSGQGDPPKIGTQRRAAHGLKAADRRDHCVHR